MAEVTSMFQDEPFTILVGPAETVFRIPPLLLAKYSAPLNAMVTNGMKETQQKVAYLPEDDPETFQYFVDWALGGIYRVPDATAVELEEDKECDDSEQDLEQPSNLTRLYCEGCKKHGRAADFILTRWWCIRCKAARPSKGRCSECQQHLRPQTVVATTCCSEDSDCYSDPPSTTDWHIPGGVYPVLAYLDRFLERTCYGVGASGHREVQAFISNLLPVVPFSPNLVAHAKIYTFAEKYLVTALKELALHLLHRGLSNYEPEGICREGVVDLIKYAYQIGQHDESIGNISALKAISLEFTAIVGSAFLRRRDFCDLLREEGEFAVDFAKMQSKYLI